MNWLTDNSGVLLNGVASGLLLFCIAVGLSVIFGLMDVLNLAHGAFYLTGSYLAYQIVGEQVGSWGGFGAALAVSVVLGILLGLLMMLLTRPLLRRGHLDQALLTLGLALVLGEGLKLVFGPDDHAVAPPSSLGASVAVFGKPYPVYRLAVIGVGLLIALGIWYLIERTSAGAVIRATVADGDMVRALGIDVRKVAVAVFCGATVLATVGGVLSGPIRGASPGLDDETLILALVVIVIGGLGSVTGTFVAALLVGLVQNVGVVLAPQFASFLLFGAMALVITFRPRGLFPAVSR